MTTTTNPVNWFEIATPSPEKAKAFYGELFGWTFSADDTDPDTDYSIVDCGPDTPIKGGIFGTGGAMPNYAVPCVMVGDVAAACQRAAELGGSVLVEPQTAPNGLTFAHLRDLDGNHIGVYSPPPAA